MENSSPLPPLKISRDGRYLVTLDHHPFLWLGDTAWEMIHRLNKEEGLLYLKDRAAKGFNVVQTVLLAELDGLDTPNAYGHKPLIGHDPGQPNEAYFQFADEIIKLAGELGIYIALLPTWGDKFNKAWGQGPEIFTSENARQYGEYLGKRYAKYSNIVWVMGGDRTPGTDEHYTIIRAIAQGIRKEDPGHLMAYHPNGGKIASDWVGQEDWLDLDMFQTRHQSGFKEYKFTRRALEALPQRPVIDGEPGYENIPNLLNKWNLKRLDAADVRKSAYWNMFAGAAGHTYGCNEIWQMYDPSKKPLFGAHLPWKEAIHLPGSRQMGLMKKLFETLPWQSLHPSHELLSPFFLARFTKTLAMISAQKDLILVYSPYGSSFRLKLDLLQVEKANAFWFDPVDGEIREAGQYGTQRAVRFKPPSKGKGKDAVLLVLDSRLAGEWTQKVNQSQGNPPQIPAPNLPGSFRFPDPDNPMVTG